jgi:branched-chain amino acid transport system ATP-binding protein
MLEVRDLRAGYGQFEVLHGITLSLEDRGIVALLGHNGAGKSTLLKAIAGQLTASGGEVRFGDAPLVQRDPGTTARAGIRYVPQDANVFPAISVYDNLRIGAYTLGNKKTAFRAALDRVYALFPVLHEKASLAARLLSGGQRQMLAIAMALVTSPSVLLLDEPSAGLSPLNVQRVFDAIRQLRDEFGMSVLLVEQNVNEALRVCESAYVMQEGRIAFHAPASEQAAIIHHLWGLHALDTTLTSGGSHP